MAFSFSKDDDNKPAITIDEGKMIDFTKLSLGLRKNREKNQFIQSHFEAMPNSYVRFEIEDR